MPARLSPANSGMKDIDRRRLVVALDYPGEEEALCLLDRLDPAKCRVKIGKELFTAGGPGLLRKVHARGFEIFLDLKFHDIPNTVAGAIRAAAALPGLWMLNVHAFGGRAMLETAVAAAASSGGKRRPLVIGVTVLTSLDGADLAELGLREAPGEQALRLARLCADSGLDGVVCSAAEAAALRRELGPDFLLVTPGIRRAADQKADQKRVLGPAEAVSAGADYLVIGRPIARAGNPAAALESFCSEIHGILPNPS